MLAAMGTHGSFIFKGYFTHILGPKTCIFDGFGVPKVGIFHGWKVPPKGWNFPTENCWIQLHCCSAVSFARFSISVLKDDDPQKVVVSRRVSDISKTERHHHVYQEEQLFVQLNLVWIGMNPVSSRYKLLFFTRIEWISQSFVHQCLSCSTNGVASWQSVASQQSWGTEPLRPWLTVAKST